MAKESMVLPQVWNVSSSLCPACTNGVYQECTCNEENSYRIYKDLSTDSLDLCLNSTRRKQTNSSSSIANDFIFDDEFEEDYSSKPLPPSTTDWDSIDSMLENDRDETDNQEDIEKTPLSRRLSQSFHMQMVFVDSDESDKGSMPDVEVYYEDDEENISKTRCSSDSFSNRSLEYERNIDSRDSGYVTTDLLDVNIERVTDQTKRKNSLEPVEASTRVLASLHLHEEHENKRLKELEEQKQKQIDYESEVHKKNIDELQEMKRTLEMRIAQVNLELVQELQCRDELNSHHEALLMEADDIAETRSNPSTPIKKNSLSDASTQKATKKRFWNR